MKVKVIQEFKDLTINKVRTLKDDPFEVDKERAELLIKKGYVEPVVETASPKEKKKIEKATKKDSKDSK